MKTNVLVLCHGNMYRSPAAEAFLKQATHLRVVSAGFGPSGRRAARRMREVLAAKGHDLEAHRSRQVTERDVVWADIILYMDNGNFKRLKALNTDAALRKACCLASYIDKSKIQDPAFILISEQADFIDVVNDIQKACSAFVTATRRT